MLLIQMENSADQQPQEPMNNIDCRYCLLCQQEGIQGPVAELKSDSLEKTLKFAKDYAPLSDSTTKLILSSSPR